MSENTLRRTLSSAKETAEYARKLASRLRPSDVILLTGDIGAGKTHFARSLIQHVLAFPEDVPSPTFTLVQTYDTDLGEIWHADLYRLSNPDEVVELGLTEAFDTAICLVEWPDRLAELAPENALSLTLEMTETDGERTLMLRWRSPKWSEKLAGLGDG